MEQKEIKNIIFDMDGVLVDSEPVIEAAAIQGLKEYGVEAKPEDFEPFIGAGEDRYIGGVAEKYGLTYKTEMKDRVYEIYLDIVEEKIKIFPEAKQVLNELQDTNFELALASSADQIKVEANLRQAGIDFALFKVIVSGDEVDNKKPAPDIYQYTASKMDVKPENCLVVEDSLHGVKAARAAGMKCAAVTTSFLQKELKEAGANFICENLSEIKAYVK